MGLGGPEPAPRDPHRDGPLLHRDRGGVLGRGPHQGVSASPRKRLRHSRQLAPLPDRGRQLAGPELGLSLRRRVVVPEGVRHSRDAPQHGPRAGGAEPVDAASDLAGRRGHPAGANGLCPARQGRVDDGTAQLQRRDEHRDDRDQRGHRRPGAAADAAHAALAAAHASRRVGQLGRDPPRRSRLRALLRRRARRRHSSRAWA